MKVESLIKSLNEHKVKYLIIGATAVIAHGHVRLTKDIDIFVKPTRENIKKVLKALEAVGYNVLDVTIDEALEKKLLFRQYILETDIHPSVKGLSFEKAWKSRFKCAFKGEMAYFVSLDDLIYMKKAAGRPKDKEDLRYLEEIRRQLRKRKSPPLKKGG